MNKSVRFLLVLFLAFIFCFIARGRCGGSADTFSTGEYNRLKLKADSAKVYCVDKGFNTNYCFLVDFCIHSGKKRFFVWDFRGDSVVYASLCAHGYGKNSTASKPARNFYPQHLVPEFSVFLILITAILSVLQT